MEEVIFWDLQSNIPSEYNLKEILIQYGWEFAYNGTHSRGSRSWKKHWGKVFLRINKQLPIAASKVENWGTGHGRREKFYLFYLLNFVPCSWVTYPKSIFNILIKEEGCSRYFRFSLKIPREILHPICYWETLYSLEEPCSLPGPLTTKVVKQGALP